MWTPWQICQYLVACTILVAPAYIWQLSMVTSPWWSDYWLQEPILKLQITGKMRFVLYFSHLLMLQA